MPQPLNLYDLVAWLEYGRTSGYVAARCDKHQEEEWAHELKNLLKTTEEGGFLEYPMAISRSDGSTAGDRISFRKEDVTAFYERPDQTTVVELSGGGVHSLMVPYQQFQARMTGRETP